MRRYKGILFPEKSFDLPSKSVKPKKTEKVEKVEEPKTVVPEDTGDEYLTLSDLQKMRKKEVEKEAKSFGIDIEGKTKKELIEAIMNQ